MAHDFKNTAALMTKHKYGYWRDDISDREKLEITEACLAALQIAERVQAIEPAHSDEGFYVEAMTTITDELAQAGMTFCEAMKNGSIGPDAEKHKRQAMKGAERKMKKALAHYKAAKDSGGGDE